MTRLESSMNVTGVFDSLRLDWEDNSGCVSRLTSLTLRLWPDGILPMDLGSGIDASDQGLPSKTSAAEPITYIVPRSCMKQVPRDGNVFSSTLSSNNSTCPHVTWQPLDKCRKYIIEVVSQYSSAWNGPSSSQTFFSDSI